MPSDSSSPTAAVAAPQGPLDSGSLDEMARRLGAVVQRSPADETEVVWMEVLDGRVSDGDDWATGTPRHGGTSRRDGVPDDGGVRVRGTVQVRVRERGRVGTYRTGANGQREIDTAVRQALGQARFAEPGPVLPLARPGALRPLPVTLHDPVVAELRAAPARDLLAGGRRPGEHLALEWHELRLVVANSHGLSRATEATALTLAARCGDGPGAGYASGSARGLADLAAPLILERARRRAADRGTRSGAGADAAERLADSAVPVLLAPEAAALLVQRLADAALSSVPFAAGRSFLAGRLDQPVFDPAFTLFDDGTDGDGLPFPFDCDGWPKRLVALVTGGVVESPAVDAALGQALGRTPTPHAVGFDESRAGNLFVAAGEMTEKDLLAAVDGGLAVAALDGVRVTDPGRGRFRAVARGVRRVAGGEPAEALPDLEWHGSLEAVLGTLAGVGDRAVPVAFHGAWGATTAPALALRAVSGLVPAH